jgi:NADH dehydrogenase [ubiquinone] 1 alpha subcomplex assembly factor 7
VELRAAGKLNMTKLLHEIMALIDERGPITVEQYMQLALGHPDLGYYMNRDPFGATGDFTTAPEISQMFGELIGLWAAEVWSSMGSPDPVRLIELGPGRGTMISDALRAARIVPAFRSALDVRLIETSSTLASMQHELLVDCGAAVSWAQSLKDVSAGPAIVIGNEFLDALPVRQFVRVSGQWRERTVRLNGDRRLVFDVADKPEPYIRANAANGEVLEVSPSGHRLMFELGARLVKQGGAALLIDYGHAITSYGDTLQALRAHRYVDPLAAPGDCDLTAHVDFAAMARSASASGAAVYGPIDQGDFLRAIGIDLRTKALAERASPDRAEEFQRARARLVGKNQGEMGALFKVMAIADRKLRPPPGFQTAAANSA